MGLMKSNFREVPGLATNNVRIFLVEHVVQSIKPMSFEWVEGLVENGDFIIS